MAGWQRPTGLKDWARVASGVSLVFDELLLQSPAIRRLKAGDIVGSTTETLNYVRNSVADLTGLTKGRLRSHSDPYHLHAHQVQSHVSSKGEPEPSESSPSNVVDKSQSSESLKGTPQPEALFRPSSTSGVDNHRLDGRPSEDAENGVPILKPELYGANCISGRDSFFPEGQKAVSNNGRNRTDLGSTEPPAEKVARDRVVTEPPSRANKGNAGGAVGGEVRENKAEVTAEPRPVLNKRKARERRVPSSPLGRAMGFAGLGAGLAWGTVQESAKRLWGGRGSIPAGQSVLSPFMNEQNAERLALAFCRMRGAALKVGQMLSIQDESLVPPPVLAALESVRQGADVMPRKQLNKVIDTELGPGWKERISSFDDEPMAAASIGQVHRAVLKDGRNVVMKIQYPGVAASIDSDIDNVRLLLDYTNLIPKGLYLDQAMRVAKEELRRECDYLQEAENQKRYRGLLQDDAELYVPLVIDEFTTKGVLTSELVPGVSIDKVAQMDQKVRNRIGTKLLELTLRELFVFRFMQTDPNWGNFLYDESTKIINLIDFGAARGYSEHFVDDYLRMVLACANRDRGQIIEMSIRLGFLTGTEDPVMLDAHVEAAYATGEPFSKPGGFDFRNSNLPRRISELGSTMLRYRVTAPPDEAYSLHRKLSGAFLACVKLRAVVPCRDVLLNICERPRPGEAPAEDMDSRFSGKAVSA